MGSNFNPQILVEKLSKLNSSQQSIETLSHWCIFHMNKARQVVETWAKQFHCAPREQRVAFLYLANDILQNSRRKGAEFVSEFWKVLPDSLHDVIENGDEFGKKAALRLMNIWEERKVFGSRGQSLKEECAKRQLDNGSRNTKHPSSKLKSPGGNSLDKLLSAYESVYGSPLDEEAIFSRCRNGIAFYDKVDKDFGGDYRLDHVNGELADELKGQHAILRDCVERLTMVESSRANLVSVLQEALREEEYKLNQARDHLQVAQLHSEQANRVCMQLFGGGVPSPTTIDQPFAEGEDPKSVAAAMAAKLAASSTSAEMLTYVLSSLASEGVIGNNNPPPPEKRARTTTTTTQLVEAYIPPLPPPPPQATMSAASDELPPPPPASPPPEQPMPPPPLQPPFQYGYMGKGQVVPGGYVPQSTFAPPSTAAYQGGGYSPEGGGWQPQQQSLPAAPMGQQQN